MTPRSRMRADDVLYRQRQTHRAGGKLFYECSSEPIEPRGSRVVDIAVFVFAILVLVAVLTGVLQ